MGLLIAVPIAGFIKDTLDGFSQFDDGDRAVTDAGILEMLTQESTSS
ncbi:hypothetical protein [Nodularia sphaerocarpa]|nr:hypothetical protein [Nodularia sphaerocarpa]MDB9376177.1 hypothetical protein [Nodularia sphaerocarpa CS-585]MDB9377841.1 hypothetical protein [Nodularia sphaerocarpa CS-585A2]